MPEPSLAEMLKAADLFERVSETEREALLEIAQERRVPKGFTLFDEGDPCNGFYLVLSGRVKVYKISADGREHILHIFGPGEPVGEVPVFSGQDFPAFATTLKESRLLYFPRSGFIDLGSRQPQILLNMLATLSMRLRRFTRTIEGLSLKEVASRLAETLLDMPPAAGGGDGTFVELKMTKAQLASQLGTTPETLSRTLQRLSRLGLVRVDRRRVHLLDRDGLEELAAGGKSIDG